MSLFALNLPDRRLAGLGARVALAGALAAAGGAMAAQAAVQPQLMKLGVLLVCAAVLLGLAMSLPPRVLPLALVVGLLGLGNLDMGRITGLPILGGQEVWVLLLLAGVAVVGAAADASAGRRPAWPATLLLGGAFLALSLGSLFYAGDRDLAWGAVAHQAVQMTALAAGFFWVRRAREAQALVVCLAVLASLSAALALWQYVTPAAFNNVFRGFADPTFQGLMDYWALDIGRVGALWIFAPTLGTLLSMLLPCFLWLWFYRRGAGLQWLAASGFALTTVVVALSGTRLTLVGAAIATLVFIAAWSPSASRPRGSRRYALSALVGAVALATVLSAHGASGSNALARMLDLFGEQGRTSVSVSNRVAIYETLTDSWRSDPLFGVGLGNTQDDIELVIGYQTSPHSYWLGLLAQTGLVGTGLVALMLAGMVPHYRRLLRRLPNSPRRGLSVFVLASSAALLPVSLLDNAMFAWQIGVLFWLLQGTVLSLSVRSGERGDIDGDEGSMQDRSWVTLPGGGRTPEGVGRTRRCASWQ
jgi:hypothetical protein